MNNNGQPNSESNLSNLPMRVRLSKDNKTSTEQVSQYFVTVWDNRCKIAKETFFQINEEKLRELQRTDPEKTVPHEKLVLDMAAGTIEMLVAAIEQEKPRIVLPKR